MATFCTQFVAAGTQFVENARVVGGSADAIVNGILPTIRNARTGIL